ncbi:succinylglutamate desuccinylase/aspartoacylase family protein [Defluviimonas sp. WL0075]|uniref:Succinylglutamate desuccinylase/aspartoacylase family protein n=1 Tax=Albidovulum sediminicola TaxID=2984331 RepID=A0ABT2Z5E4_9RHOB|nr:succinylglutamate desuccinylase/aspartoacylase family protein [Defluviimonas sp. WL0075]MCV2866369.1 succinylglutamate desuccinylase/aspartoacylase family protein [Defluviimonas sp. WL0075]
MSIADFARGTAISTSEYTKIIVSHIALIFSIHFLFYYVRKLVGRREIPHTEGLQMPNHASDSRLRLTIDLDRPGRSVGDLMLRWSDNTNPLGYHPIPVISIKGRDGPVVLILGGTHGDEFEGPAAIMRLARRLSPDTLAGQVILIPALNAPALAASSRVNPLDGANLNRAFPGDADGGPSAMLAHFVETVLMPRVDAVIDLHSGGKAAFFQPCALATRTADSGLYARNLALAKAFGLPLIWVLGENNDNRSVNAAAERAGVPMIAAELGGGGGSDPAITGLAEFGLLQCLGYLGLVDSPPVSNTPPRRVQIASPLDSVYAPADCLFDRAVSAGQDVSAGQTVGWVHHPAEPERASRLLSFPTDGLVLAHICRGMVRRGELLALVARDVPEGH